KKDGSGVMVRSRIGRTTDGRYFVNEKNEEDSVNRIYADQTTRITFQDKRKGVVVEGIAMDGAWLFKIVPGKISLYSCFPPPDFISNACISAFQVGDNPIEMVGLDKLRTAIGDNKKAIAIFDKENVGKNNYVKAVQKFNKD